MPMDAVPSRVVPLDAKTVDALVTVALRAPGIADHWSDAMANLCRVMSRQHGARGWVSPEQERRLSCAYAVGFVPRYLPRVIYALRGAGLQVRRLVDIAEGRISILDVGCGPGTASLALLHELNAAADACSRTLSVAVLARDKSSVHLDTAEAVVRELERNDRWPCLQIDWQRDEADLFAAAPRRADLIVFGHSICEKYQRQYVEDFGGLFEQICSFIADSLTTRGVAIVLEPILAFQSDIALRIRDHVAGRPDLGILGPCPRGTFPCPELRLRDDQAACGTATAAVTWRLNKCGRALLKVMHRAGWGSLARDRAGHVYGQVNRSENLQFFALVVGRKPRADMPEGVGTSIVRPDAEGYRFVCVADEFAMRVIAVKEPCGSEPMPYGGVTTRFLTVLDEEKAKYKGDLPPWDVSALYPDGWP